MVGADFFDQLGTIAAMILRADDEILSDINVGPSMRGYRIRRNGSVLEIYGRPDMGRFTVEYEYRISGVLYNQMDAEDAREYVPESEQPGRDGGELREFAAKARTAALDDHVEQQALETLQEDLTQQNRGDVDIQRRTVTHLEEDHWDGMAIVGRLYPDDDQFGPMAYDETIRRIRYDGRLAARAIHSEVPVFDEVDDAVDGNQSDGGTLADTRGFH